MSKHSVLDGRKYCTSACPSMSRSSNRSPILAETQQRRTCEQLIGHMAPRSLDEVRLVPSHQPLSMGPVRWILLHTTGHHSWAMLHCTRPCHDLVAAIIRWS